MRVETPYAILEKPLILASRSPRRSELLRQMGIPFEIVPSEVEEELVDSDRPDVLAMTVARQKAEDVARAHPNRLILAADTIVYLDHHVLGKPRDRDEAREMLRALRNQTHGVVTGICLIGPDGGAQNAAETTRVHMRDCSDAELENYLATDEPLDKAGAYGIQGAAAQFIDNIEGDYFNVVGLPLRLLLALLQKWVNTSTLRLPNPPDRFYK